ncbi:MAG: tol-pal system-associated acyl-CoA thioesterase, partial [Pseudomonadota bacterium]
YYEDTDAGGVVYHSQYLNFLERARTEWLRELGYEQDSIKSEFGLVFAVRSLEVEYIKPALFNDQLQINVEIKECRAASILFQHSITKFINNQTELILTAMVKVACVNIEKQAASAIPEPIYKVIKTCM